MSGLILTRISHSYGDVMAVQSLDLHVASGEIVCLLGPSGCGKSTVLRLAAGLEDLQDGEIEIGGKTMASGASRTHVPPESRSVGLMFQDYALFPHLTVRENIAFGMGNQARANKDAVDTALLNVGLAEVADRYPHTLSGGQQQRIALLRALMPEPRVMLLDEPFSGLDQYMRQQVRQESLRALKSAGAATLMVTHDPEEALYLADRVVVMQAGSVVQDSAPVELYQAPRTPFVARLFGPVNEFQVLAACGVVRTPLGEFPTDLEGPVLVIVRASDVVMDSSAQPQSQAFDVVSARLLGSESEVMLEGPEGAVEMQVHGVQLPDAGSKVHVRVGPGARVHVSCVIVHVSRAIQAAPRALHRLPQTRLAFDPPGF